MDIPGSVQNLLKALWINESNSILPPTIRVDGRTVILITIGYGDNARYACVLYHTGKVLSQLQWPEEKLIPGFREAFQRYLIQVQRLSMDFSSLVAEALGLGTDGLSPFYDEANSMQHRAKILKYPSADSDNNQGVGPHYDIGFLTFVNLCPFLQSPPPTQSRIQLLQASNQTGLQVQNLGGQWIDAPPIPGTFVVNIGKGPQYFINKTTAIRSFYSA